MIGGVLGVFWSSLIVESPPGAALSGHGEGTVTGDDAISLGRRVSQTPHPDRMIW